MPFTYTSSNQFGLDTTTIRTGYAAWLKNVDDDAMGTAINVVTGDVCRMLRSIQIDPAGITTVLYPDDFLCLQALAADGALGKYSMTTGYAQEQGKSYFASYQRRLEEIRKNPSEFLESYTNVSGVNTVGSHTQNQTAAEAQAVAAMFPNPLNRINSWVP